MSMVWYVRIIHEPPSQQWLPAQSLTKSQERQLAKQQAYTLDTVRSITSILEEEVTCQWNQMLATDHTVHGSQDGRNDTLQNMSTCLLHLSSGMASARRPRHWSHSIVWAMIGSWSVNMAVEKSTSGLTNTQFLTRAVSSESSLQGMARIPGVAKQKYHPYKQPGSQWCRKQEHKMTQILHTLNSTFDDFKGMKLTSIGVGRKISLSAASFLMKIVRETYWLGCHCIDWSATCTCSSFAHVQNMPEIAGKKMPVSQLVHMICMI